MLFCVIDFPFAGQVHLTHGGNNVHVGLAEYGFKTELVVSFSRTAVGKGNCTFFFGSFDHFLGNQGAGYGCAHDIAFVVTVGFYQGEDVIPYELFLCIDRVVLVADLLGFCISLPDFLFGLADVYRNCNYFIVTVLFFEDGNAHRGVKPTGICKCNFFYHAFTTPYLADI